MSLFTLGSFTSHSGLPLGWKIDCDALTSDDWAAIAAVVGPKLEFGHVYGIPNGGMAFAEAMKPYASPVDSFLVCDDVLTTGGSMEQVRQASAYDGIEGYDVIHGVVLFSRAPSCPSWITPVFTINPRFS